MKPLEKHPLAPNEPFQPQLGPKFTFPSEPQVQLHASVFHEIVFMWIVDPSLATELTNSKEHGRGRRKLFLKAAWLEHFFSSNAAIA